MSLSLVQVGAPEDRDDFVKLGEAWKDIARMMHMAEPFLSSGQAADAGEDDQAPSSQDHVQKMQAVLTQWDMCSKHAESDESNTFSEFVMKVESLLEKFVTKQVCDAEVELKDRVEKAQRVMCHNWAGGLLEAATLDELKEKAQDTLLAPRKGAILKQAWEDLTEVPI